MQRRQFLLFGGIFAGLITLLAVGYFAFLRPGYALLYQDLREADAAAIVAQLDKDGIPYRLADGGHSVLVPENEADRARVAIAGSGVATGGVVGFELFNESDMGLTEFAQKVNYQRALQGELARTIMTMEGISFARVHLSLPERGLFRADRTAPKAAVTIETRGGERLGMEQVTGIQRLLASAVGGLAAQDVAVLDARGDLISPVPADTQSGALDERSALEAYFRARAQAAAENILPGLPFELRVTAIGSDGEEATMSAPEVTPPSPIPAEAGPKDADAKAAPAVKPAKRNFRLRLALRTESDLNEENRRLLREAIGQAVALDSGNGDLLRFETGPLGLTDGQDWTGAGRQDGWTADRAVQPATPARHAPIADVLPGLSPGWLIALATLVGAGVVWLRRGRSRMSAEDQQSFARLLDDSLAQDGGAGHAR